MKEALSKLIHKINIISDRTNSDSRMDWLGLETILCAILKDGKINNNEKVGLCKSAINECTGRGHFMNDDTIEYIYDEIRKNRTTCSKCGGSGHDKNRPRFFCVRCHGAGTVIK